MSTSTIIRARIETSLKEEATAVLDSMGMTMSEAMRLLMTRIAREKKFPFAPLEPNQETIDAMLSLRRGEGIFVGSIDNLFNMMNDED